jgi:hypothetical protein
MQARTQIVPVQLPNGQIIQVDTTVLGGEEDVAFSIFTFDGVTEVLEGISAAIVGTLEKVKPRKATIEFGLEVAVESGKLTALLVKGAGKGSLKIALEWSGESLSA